VTKERILFVDDQEKLLSGLRRMLRDQRNEWDMHFVGSGAEALELMRSHDFSVIVSDMWMPEMDGAELLSIVQKEYPQTIRIILSGYADNEAVLRTVGLSHQYLAKPCDPAQLKEIISNTLRARPLLHQQGLRELVASLKTIPVPSSTYLKLMVELKSQVASVNSVAKVLESDIALSSQILKLTNSAYFALPVIIHSMEQAVRLLGLDTIKSLATIANFFHSYDGDKKSQAVLETLNERSISIGVLARQLCRSQGCEEQDAETAFCIGLLSHIGTLVLVTNLPEKFSAAITYVEESQWDIMAAEKHVFGATHADLGAYLLGLWGFPDTTIETVRLHHDDRVMESEKFTPSQAVYIAQAFGRYSKTGFEGKGALVPSRYNSSIAHNAKFLSQFENWRCLFEEMPDG